MTNLTSSLSKCYASAIHDVLREKGYGNCVLLPERQALERGQKLFGEIFYCIWPYRQNTFEKQISSSMVSSFIKGSI